MPTKTVSASNPFVDHIVELLASFGSIKARRMFGGWGLSYDGLSIGLIAFERLYLKVDVVTKPNFMAAKCEPFVYEGKSKTVEMSYWTVPDEAMDAPHLMQPWGQLAIEAALRAANAKSAKPARKAAAKKIAAKKTVAKRGKTTGR
jgi:DNA transformation protein and related proteins